jgi:hypothetical protein
VATEEGDIPLIDGFERNERRTGPSAFHLDVVTLDRREVLIQKIPLPPFGGVRRL